MPTGEKAVCVWAVFGGPALHHTVRYGAPARLPCPHIGRPRVPHAAFMSLWKGLWPLGNSLLPNSAAVCRPRTTGADLRAALEATISGQPAPK